MEPDDRLRPRVESGPRREQQMADDDEARQGGPGPGSAAARPGRDGDRDAPAGDLRAQGGGRGAWGHRHEMQATYRYLRLAIIVLSLLLALAVGMQIAADGGQVLSSVSAYYYTGARDVFVGTLCAIGACLIIHRGRSDTEDLLLNGAGYLSFFIAFVPTSPAEVMGGGPVPDDLLVAATQNTWAVLAAGLVGLLIEIIVLPQRERHRHSRGGRVVLLAGVVSFVALVSVFFFAPDLFLARAHGAAASLWFVCIVGIVGVNAIGLSRSRAASGINGSRRWMNWYTLGFVLILVTVPIMFGPVQWLLPGAWFFLLEATVFLQFIAFWVVQTIERWHTPTRRADALVPG